LFVASRPHCAVLVLAAMMQSLIRFPNSLCLAWKHLGRTCGWSKEVTEVSKGKGKASQKAMVAPPGQQGQVGWRNKK
jgi:hypothetical protein